MRTADKSADSVCSFFYSFITYDVAACAKDLHLLSYEYEWGGKQNVQWCISQAQQNFIMFYVPVTVHRG